MALRAFLTTILMLSPPALLGFFVPLRMAAAQESRENDIGPQWGTAARCKSLGLDLSLNSASEFKVFYEEAEAIHLRLAKIVSDFLANLSPSAHAILLKKHKLDLVDLQWEELQEALQETLKRTKRSTRHIDCKISYHDRNGFGALHWYETSHHCQIELDFTTGGETSVSAFYKISRSSDKASISEPTRFGAYGFFIEIPLSGDGVVDSKRLWKEYRRKISEYLLPRSDPYFFNSEFDFFPRMAELEHMYMDTPETLDKIRTEAGFRKLVRNALASCPASEDSPAITRQFRGFARKTMHMREDTFFLNY